MSHILLLGAGFSRNWGGWLASEAFEYLIGCPEIMGDGSLNRLLWQHQLKGGGFEDALAELQLTFNRTQNKEDEQRLMAFQDALKRMFGDMNEGFLEYNKFEDTTFEPRMLRTFLSKFDAIFTLNQDILLEHRYLTDRSRLEGARSWRGKDMPGMQRLPTVYDPPSDDDGSWAKPIWVPRGESDFEVMDGYQPFFKLHGSSNWRIHDGSSLLVMGGGKAAAIGQHKILKWYAEQFDRLLSQPGTSLMVIGYGFRDEHINKAITGAVETSGLRMFIICPEGADLARTLNPTSKVSIYDPTPLEETFKLALIGASRRGLRDTFGGDGAEHRKVVRFFD